MISGAIYVPWELWELLKGITWVRACLLGVNLLVVGYLIWALLRNREKARKRVAGVAGRRVTTPS